MLSRLKGLLCTSESGLNTCENETVDEKQILICSIRTFSGRRFESLPNELIFEIFDYLSISDIYYAFYNLNQYFNEILCLTRKHVNYELKDRQIDSDQFRFMINEVLPSCKNLQLKSIDLSYGVSEHFCNVLFWHRFSHSIHTINLQFLSFGSSTRLFDVMKTFPNLKHFSLSICTASNTDWLDGEKWDFFVENICPELIGLSVSIRDIQHPSLPLQLEEKVYSSFKSSFWSKKTSNIQLTILRRNPERIHRVTLKIFS